MAGGRGRAAALTGLAVLCVPLVTLAMIITHEVGHTVVARLSGDPRAYFLLYGPDCTGCNVYDSRLLTPWGNVAVSVGGVAFTMLLTVAAVTVLGWRRRPRWVPRWLLLEIILICYGGDLVWQFVQAIQQLPVPEREPLGHVLGYTDFSAATSFGSQATGWSHDVVAVIGFGAAALYTLVMALELRRAWRRSARASAPPAARLARAPAARLARAPAG